MGVRYDNQVLLDSGKPASFATITVNVANGSAASIYSDDALSVSQSNPTSTDVIGNFGFYAAEGLYDIIISGAGITTKTLHDVPLVTPSTPLGNASQCWGDSITFGVGASSPANSYVSKIAAAMGWSATNNGVSGTGISDEADAIYTTTVSDSMISTLLTGVNDMRNFGTDGAKQTTYKNALYATVAWLAIPSAKKIVGRNDLNGGRVTYGGTWSNTGAYSSLLGTQATVIGNTATVSVYGSTVYVASLAQVGNTSTFSINVDGVSYGTYSTNTTLTTILGRAYHPFLIRIPGLSNAVHTVVVTTVSCDGSNPVYFSWVAGNNGAYTRTGPHVFVGNCLRFTAAGYSANGGSNASVSQLNELIREVCEDLVSDGLSILLVDVGAYYDPITSGTTDGVHPGDAGHLVIANAFLQGMSRVVTPLDRGMAKQRGVSPHLIIDGGNVYLRSSVGKTVNVQDVVGSGGSLIVGSVTIGPGVTSIVSGSATTRNAVRTAFPSVAIGSIYLSTAGKMYLKVANAAADADWQRVSSTAAD